MTGMNGAGRRPRRGGAPRDPARNVVALDSGTETDHHFPNPSTPMRWVWKRDNKVRAVSAMKLAVLTPVFDDWPAFARLLQEISLVATDLPFALEIVAVDDGSSVSYDLSSPAPDAICEVEILRLGLNLGHQRAIAIGLVE